MKKLEYKQSHSKASYHHLTEESAVTLFGFFGLFLSFLFVPVNRNEKLYINRNKEETVQMPTLCFIRLTVGS